MLQRKQDATTGSLALQSTIRSALSAGEGGWVSSGTHPRERTYLRAPAAGSKSGGMAMKLVPLELLSNTNVKRRRRRVNAKRPRMRLTQGSTGQGATQHRLG